MIEKRNLPLTVGLILFPYAFLLTIGVVLTYVGG